MTSPTQTFGPPDIAHWFTPNDIRKAHTYGHAVYDLSIAEAEISAWVKGTMRMPYRVQIQFFQANGRLQIDANCTCPVGRFCKHCVAVLVATLAGRARGPTMTAPARPSKAILAWAEETQAALHPASAVARKTSKPNNAKEALHYLILPAAPGGDAQLVLFKGRINAGMPVGKLWNNIDRALLDPPQFVDNDDLDILRQVRRLVGNQRYWDDLPLVGADAAGVLAAVAASGRAWVVASQGRNYSPSDWHCLPLRPGEARRARLAWHLDGQGNTQALLQADPAAAHLLPTEPLWYLDSVAGEAGPLDCGSHAALLRRLLKLPALARADLPVVAELLAEIAPDLPRPSEEAALDVIEGPPLPVLKLASGMFTAWNAHRGYPPHPGYRPRPYDYAGVAFRYGKGEGEKQVETVPGDQQHYVTLADGRTARIMRDLGAEAARQEELRALGFAPLPSRAFVYSGTSMAGKLGLESEAVWQRFFADLAPRLIAAGWALEYPRDYRHHVLEAESWEADLEEEGNGWFKLDLGILVEGQRLSLAPLLAELFHREPRWLDAAKLKRIPLDEAVILHTATGERVRVAAERIKPLASTLIDLFDALPASGELRVSALDAPRLDFLADQARWQFKGDDELFRLAQRLKQAQGVKAVAPPPGFTLDLRPYQREGLAWLQFLREQNLAGILADDMGLGKTAQTLAHLLTEKQAGRLDQPALVVLPTSLVFNWKREAQRCAPDLKVLSLHGPARADAFPLIPQHDICLTTYPLLWRDEEELARHAYSFLILDEAQTVKNAKARAAGVVRRLQARHRLCLTGTPLENHLGELWAQFDFLLPGFLGDTKQFTTTWRTPIEKHGDQLRRDLLARRIAPFILRRKKEDVAKELPAKTIIVRSVELEGGQRDLYETVRAAMDAKVKLEIASKGFNRSQIIILDALLKLRQVCCDPRLLKTVQAAAKVKERAKLDLLMDMLPELVDEGRRVLLFSQFTSMLALIAEELDRAGIGYVSLTGDTRDREEVVGRFQDGQVPVFLISLKAGGVGLNLTTADTVIHFDPWWNPAAENQATDRAHRIGQKNKVFVYKLVAAGSIEERIVALQEKKAALAEGVLSEDAAALSKFGEEDLRALLAPLPGK